MKPEYAILRYCVSEFWPWPFELCADTPKDMEDAMHWLEVYGGPPGPDQGERWREKRHGNKTFHYFIADLNEMVGNIIDGYKWKTQKR